MGNVESCCAYGASPRSDRTPKLKPGGAYRGSNNRSNGHYAHQQVRIETQLIKERIKFDIIYVINSRSDKDLIHKSKLLIK